MHIKRTDTRINDVGNQAIRNLLAFTQFTNELKVDS